MFSLKQLRKQIWHLHFDQHYDLTMHFLRYQEFYESPKFRKTNLTLVNYMEWYARNMGKGVFTYTKDWAGFNLPGEYIFSVHKEGIQDPNRYDKLMLSLAEFICSKEDNKTDFYIIGTSQEDTDLKSTFNHELAHGMFYTDEKYKTKMTALVNALPNKTKNFIFKKLKKCGYSDEFFIDETQAYLSTGLIPEFNKPMVEQEVPKFEKLFKKTSGRLKKR